MWPFKKKECDCDDDKTDGFTWEQRNYISEMIMKYVKEVCTEMQALKTMCGTREYMIVDPEMVYGLPTHTHVFHSPISGRKQQIWVPKDPVGKK